MDDLLVPHVLVVHQELIRISTLSLFAIEVYLGFVVVAVIGFVVDDGVCYLRDHLTAWV